MTINHVGVAVACIATCSLVGCEGFTTAHFNDGGAGGAGGAAVGGAAVGGADVGGAQPGAGGLGGRTATTSVGGSGGGTGGAGGAAECVDGDRRCEGPILLECVNGAFNMATDCSLDGAACVVNRCEVGLAALLRFEEGMGSFKDPVQG